MNFFWLLLLKYSCDLQLGFMIFKVFFKKLTSYQINYKNILTTLS